MNQKENMQLVFMSEVNLTKLKQQNASKSNWNDLYEMS